MAGRGFLACNPFRDVCCSNSAAEHSDAARLGAFQEF